MPGGAVFHRYALFRDLPFRRNSLSGDAAIKYWVLLDVGARFVGDYGSTYRKIPGAPAACVRPWRVDVDIWRDTNTYGGDVQSTRLACQIAATSSDRRDGGNLAKRELPRRRFPEVKQRGPMAIGPASARLGRAGAGSHVAPEDIKRRRLPRAK